MNSKACYCEVVFPVRLSPLTYAIPKEMLHIIKPGILVEAPLKGNLKKGIVLRYNGCNSEVLKIHFGNRVIPFHGQLKASELEKNYIRILEGGCILKMQFLLLLDHQ